MPRIAILLLLVAAVAVGSASGPGSASAVSTAPMVYTDSTGDSASAPDLTKLTVTPGNGTVTFDLAFTGDIGSDGDLIVAFDADRNRQTGDNGYDYLYIANSSGAGFGKWDGTQWGPFAHQPTSPSVTATDLTFTITLADMGGVTSFDFYAESDRGNDSDFIPNIGVLTYTVPVAPPPPPPPAPAPAVKSLLVPSGVLLAKAGKVLRVPPLQLVLTDGTTVTADSQTCSLKLKGKKVPSLAGGCAWKIPKTYKKARLVLAVTYVYGGKTSTVSWPVIPG